jgi:hypothetical protein
MPPGRSAVSRLLGLALAGLLGSSCGGGKTMVPASCLSLAAAALPAPSTAVARQGAASSCEEVVVDVVLTGVDDVFAASFDVTFDPSVARYRGSSTAGSRLASDGATVQVLQTIQTGWVRIGVSRLNVTTGVDFTAPAPLVSLIFLPVGTAPAAAPLTFSSTRVLGSETPPQEKPGISWFGGTLRID